MKKYTLATIGIVIQVAGLALMLYGLSNNRQLLWFGLSMVFVGLVFILVGLFRNNAKYK